MKTRMLAIIPVKDLNHTKSRLKPVLTLAERQALTLHILSGTIQALKASDKVQCILVLTPDDRVLSFVKGLGVMGLKDDGRGLNQALRQATRWAIDHDFEAILILPCDIPFLDSEDIKTIRGMGVEGERVVVIAPNEGKNGTNALFVKPPGILRYSFGIDSFTRYQEHAFAQHFKVKVYSSLSIGFDLDDPEQYRFLVGEQHFFEKVNLNEVKTRYIDSNSWNSPYPAGR
jgi:2-phospho-L-lactate guanylyltransferase